MIVSEFFHCGLCNVFLYLEKLHKCEYCVDGIKADTYGGCFCCYICNSCFLDALSSRCPDKDEYKLCYDKYIHSGFMKELKKEITKKNIYRVF